MQEIYEMHCQEQIGWERWNSTSIEPEETHKTATKNTLSPTSEEQTKGPFFSMEKAHPSVKCARSALLLSDKHPNITSLGAKISF